MADQIEECFGPLVSLPNLMGKRDTEQNHRPPKTQKLEKGKGDGKPKRKGRSHQDMDQDMNEESILTLAAKLILRHEDSIHILRANHAWVLFMGNTPENPLLKSLFDVANKWKSEHQKGAPVGRLPLRVVLFQTIMLAMSRVLDQVDSDEALQEKAESNGWLNQGQWQYQQWNAEHKVLQTDTSRKPLEHDKVKHAVQQMKVMAGREGVVHRLHSTRPLSAQMQSNTVVFLLEIGIRSTEATDVYQALEVFQGLTALQLLQIQLKKDISLKRTPLAQRLQAMLAS